MAKTTVRQALADLGQRVQQLVEQADSAAGSVQVAGRHNVAVATGSSGSRRVSAKQKTRIRQRNGQTSETTESSGVTESKEELS